MNRIGQRQARVLLVDDDPSFLRTLCRVLELEFDVYCATSTAEGLHLLRQQTLDLALIDYSLQDGSNGLELMAAIRRFDPTIAVLLLSGTIDVPACANAMQMGASDVIVKPPEFDRLIKRLQDCLPAVDTARRHRAQTALIDDPYGLFDASTAMRSLMNKVVRVAPAKVPVLLGGEPGTGKRAVAQVIHQLSAERDHPLVVLALDDLTTEPAVEVIRQLRERLMPASATLWLREVDLARSDTRRLVDELLDRPNRILVTLAGGQNEPVLPERAEGSTWARLSPFSFVVPPLRERGEQAIEARASFFLTKLRRHEGRGPLLLSPEAREVLLSYSWPGNVAQLHQVLFRAFASSGDASSISSARIRDALEPALKATSEPLQSKEAASHLRWSLRGAEYRQILAVLEHTGGHISQSAQLLGITRSTLYRKMQEFGISAH